MIGSMIVKPWKKSPQTLISVQLNPTRIDHLVCPVAVEHIPSCTNAIPGHLVGLRNAGGKAKMNRRSTYSSTYPIH